MRIAAKAVALLAGCGVVVFSGLSCRSNTVYEPSNAVLDNVVRAMNSKYCTSESTCTKITYDGVVLSVYVTSPNMYEDCCETTTLGVAKVWAPCVGEAMDCPISRVYLFNYSIPVCYADADENGLIFFSWER